MLTSVAPPRLICPVCKHHRADHRDPNGICERCRRTAAQVFALQEKELRLEVEKMMDGMSRVRC